MLRGSAPAEGPCRLQAGKGREVVISRQLFYMRPIRQDRDQEGDADASAQETLNNQARASCSRSSASQQFEIAWEASALPLSYTSAPSLVAGADEPASIAPSRPLGPHTVPLSGVARASAWPGSVPGDPCWPDVHAERRAAERRVARRPAGR